jgi:hypothetical protein
LGYVKLCTDEPPFIGGVSTEKEGVAEMEELLRD